MILINEELKYACAWGRWRIGPALNEPLPCTERRLPRRPLRAAGPRRRSRARLQLVSTQREPRA
jgi:hypothetical protein